MAFEIHNEPALYAALESFERGGFDEEIRFVGWPRLQITIKGEDFDGGVPTRIMPAFVRYQRAIDRAYARSLGKDGRRLTQEEYRRVELIVRMKPGSTTFVSELGNALNQALAAAVQNMSGIESVIAILGVAGIAGSVVAWKAYLNSRAALRKIDYQARMSEEETRRFQILAGIANTYGSVRAHVDDMADAQGELLRRLDDRDQLLVGDEPLVDGEVGRRLARNPRLERIQDRLDGNFIILSVDSGRVRSGFRVRVRDTSSRDELTVAIPTGTLPPDQISELQSGEWEKAPLRMRINIVRVGEKITEATLVSAGLSRAEP